MTGTPQRLVLGGAGAYDVIVISGLLAVLLSELVGEILERAARANGQEPSPNLETPFRKGGGRA